MNSIAYFLFHEVARSFSVNFPDESLVKEKGPISANNPKVLAPPGPPWSQITKGASALPSWEGKYQKNMLLPTFSSDSKKPA